ncbi:siderophore-interacting protein [Dermabacteraceae bacterium P7054]
MSDAPKPLTQEEANGLLEVVQVLEKEYAGKIAHVIFTVTEVFPRAKKMVRVRGQLPEGTDMSAWTGPNVAFSLEIPIPAEELEGIEGAPQTSPRRYTVADYDVAARTLDIDFVLHEGDTPAMLWLRDAKPGTTIELESPRVHFLPPKGESLVLVADSTAVPAVLRICAEHPLPAQTTLLTSAARDELPELAGVKTVFVSQEALGEEFTKLPETNAADALWAAGEQGQMRIVRRHWRKTLGRGKEQIAISGYWRAGISATARDIEGLRGIRDALAAGSSLAEITAAAEESDDV